MLYARLLDASSRIGLGLMVLAFLAYFFGLIPAHVPLDELPQYWSLPAHEFAARTQTPIGWGWLSLVPKGDMLTLLGIAWLAGCSLVSLAVLLPIYLRRGDRIYAGLALAEIAVILMAASGVLAGGH
jgi:hypothetical protein